MPIGTKLSVLRQMLNAECGEEMDETISPARISINNQLLSNQQAFMVNQHAYLLGKVRATVQAQAGVQYYALPAGLDMDRPTMPAYTNVNGFRYRISYGIGQEEYNLYRSDQGVTSTPVMRWDLVNVAGVLQIEMWPIPSVPQVLELEGTQPLALTPLVADTDTCVIDDLVLVLFTAAEILARKQSGDAQAKAAKAQSALASIKGSLPGKIDTFNMSGAKPQLADFYQNNHRRPVVGTS